MIGSRTVTKTTTVLMTVVLFASLLVGFSLPVKSVYADPNAEINYQGKLTDTSGVAVADGTYNMRFWLLQSTAQATTSAIWTESLTGSNKVQVTNGLFSVMLGSTSALTSVDFNQELYLGVEIGGSTTPDWDGEMLPRKPLGTVPAAFEAFKLGGVASSSFLRSDTDDTMTAFLTLTGGASTSDINISGTATTTNLVINNENFSDLTGTGLINNNGSLEVSSSSLNLTLDGLSDVDTTNVSNGNLLSYSGSSWATTSTSSLGLGDGSLEGLSDVSSMTENYGDLFYWNGNAWADIATSALKVAISDTTGTLGVSRGGTGLTTFGGANTILYTTAADTLSSDTTFVYDGTYLGIGTTTPTTLLTVGSSTASYLTAANLYNSALVSGALEVGGLSHLGGGLMSYASSTFLSGLSIVGNATTTGTLIVQGSGTSTFGGGLQTTGNLDINGTGTSTFQNGISLEGGCFRDASGTCLSASADTQIVVAANDTDATLKAHADYVADGTDDQDEIQSAIDYVYANGGGTVHLLAGTFTVGTTTYTDSAVRLATSTQLIGQGDSTIIKLRDNFDANISIIYGYSSENAYVGHLAVDGNKANQGAAIYYGIRLGSRGGSSTIEHTYVYDVEDYGIYLSGAPSNILFNNTVTGCLYGIRVGSPDNILTGNVTNHNDVNGIYISNGGGNTLTGNVANYNVSGIRVGGSYYNVIVGNTTNYNTVSGLYASSDYNSDFNGNTSNYNVYGIYANLSQYSNITGNNFTGNSSNGIYLDFGFHTTFIGNHLYDNGGSGATSSIALNNALDGSLVSNNDIYDTAGTGYAIDIDAGSTGVVLADNVYSGTGATAIRDLSSNTEYTQHNRITVNATDSDFASGAYTALTVTQSGTGDVVNFFDGSNEVFTILDGGKVGIGTTTPTTLLTVGSSTASYLTAANLYNSALVSGALEVGGLSHLGGGLMSYASSTFLNGLSIVGNATTTGTLIVQGSGTSTFTGGIQTSGNLDVNGTATSTFQNGISLEGGCFRDASGTCLSASADTQIVVAANDTDATLKAHADYVADGTDDQDEIQSAIDYVYANGGGTVHLLAGTFTVGTTTYTDSAVRLATSTQLIGQGDSTIIKLRDNFDDDIYVVYAYGVRDVYVGYLAVDGNKGNQSGVGENDGIYFETGSSTIEHTYVHDMVDYGIIVSGYYVSGGGNYNKILSNIVTANAAGVFIGDSDYSIISGNIASHSSGSIHSHGFHIADCLHNTISNNVANNNYHGFLIEVGSFYNTISNNVANDNTYDGIRLNTVLNNTIVSNSLNDNGYAGIGLSTALNNSITSNSLKGNQYGILGDTGAQNTISSNTFYSNDYGILLDSGSSNNTIIGNFLYNNGGSGATSSITVVLSNNNIFDGNYIYDSAGTGYAIDIDAGSSGTVLADNVYSGTGASSIRDLSSDTEYTQHNRITVNATDSDFSSGAYTALTVTQSGTGDVVNFFDGSNEVFTILDGGKVGIGTSTPTTLLTVGSSTASYLTAANLYNSALVSGALEVGGLSHLGGGLMSYASSTFLNGLSIVGNATTTGTLIVQGSGTSTFGGGLQTTGNLDINGTGTSTFQNGISLEGGCFRDASGTCLSASADTQIVVAANDTDATLKAHADYVADGTDDQDEIQSAIDYVYANGGGTVHLLAGTFTVGTTTYTDSAIRLATSTQLVGQGDATVIKLRDNFDDDISLIRANTDTQNTYIGHLAVDGNKANQGAATYYGIFFGAGSSTVDHTHIHDVQDTGIIVYGNYNIITGNNVSNNGNIGIYTSGNYSTVSNNIANYQTVGIYAQGSAYITVTGNIASYNTHGISLSSDHNTVTGNVASYNTGNGFYVGGEYCNIVGNIANYNQYGIHTFLAGECSIDSNNITGNDYGMYLDLGYSLNVTGNSFFANGGSGATSTITLNTVYGGALISGNYIVDTAGTGYAIDIDVNSSGIVLSNNVYSGTGATAIRDLSSNTEYTQHNRITVNATDSDFASGAYTALTVTQSGTGDVVNFLDGSNEVFTILDGGNVGIGTSTNLSRKLTVEGDTETNNLYLANPGITNSSKIHFLKTSDTASVNVTETADDQTRYAFEMADNPDSSSDRFVWHISDWKGDGGDWEPLRFSALDIELKAADVKAYGNYNIYGPWYSGGTYPDSGQPNTVTESKTGTLSITPDVTDFSGDFRLYVVKIDGTGSPNTFKWDKDCGDGVNCDYAEGSGISITGGAQTLDSGVTITFSGTTGGVIGDKYTFRVYKGGHVLASDGSLAAPTFSFSNDSDTGVYLPASNELGLVTGATEALRIDSAGRVGIGTSTPNSKLTVAGNTNIDSYTNLPGYYINSMPAVTGSTTLNNFFFAGASSTSFISLSNYNYAIGDNALTNIYWGSNNFAVGGGAFAGSTTANVQASDNNALGYQTLFVNKNGSNNNAFGNSVLKSNTTGSSNNGMGYYSLFYNTTGGSNNAIGSWSLYLNTTGSYNNAIGYESLYTNTTGSHNNAFGNESMYSNITGWYNNALGYQALRQANDGSYNNAFGYKALTNNTGTGTIAIGYQAADNATGVDRGIFLGYNIDAFSTTADDQLNIGNLIFGNSVDGTGTTISSGNIGIATTSSTARLTVQSTGTSDILNLFETGGSEVFTVLENGNVGIGTTSPSAKLNIFDTAEQLRLSYDDTNYTSLQSDSSGFLKVGVNGTNRLFIGPDALGGGAYTNIWPGAVTPTSNNYAWQTKTDGTEIWFNAASGGYIGFTINNSSTFPLMVKGTSAGVGYAYNDSLPALFSVNGQSYFDGNVGIGTTTPTSLLTVGSSTPTAIPVANQYNSAYISGLLEVGGTGTSTFAGTLDINGTGTSTFQNGISLEGGCFRDASGTCLSASADTQIVVAANDTDATLKAHADYVADGTDDQDEIQSAIDYVYANGGGTVHLLAGTFTVGTTTYTDSAIRLATSTQLVGQGDATIIKLRDNFDANISIIYGYSSANAYVGHLAVDGNKANQGAATYYGIHLGLRGGSSTIEHAHVYDVQDTGIYSLGFYSVISNNLVSGNNYGVRVSAENNTVSDNIANYNTSAGIFMSSGHSIAIGNNVSSSTNGIVTGGSSYDNTITANVIEDCVYALGPGQRNVFSSNNIINNTYGVFFTAWVFNNSNTFTDNTFYGNDYAVYVPGGNWYNRFYNNIFSDNGGTGATSTITLVGASNIVIVGNSIYDQAGTAYAIDIDAGSSNITLANNSHWGTGATAINNLSSTAYFTDYDRITVNANDTNYNGAYTALSITQSGTGDVVNFFDGSNEVFTILDGGSVGIGTSSPASELDVWGDFQVGTSATPTLFVDASSERVGIGTNNPLVTLDIEDASYSAIRVNRPSHAYYSELFYNSGSSGFAISNDDDFDITVNSTNVMHFEGDGGSNQYNVGIGTTSPSAKLTIQGTAGSNIFRVASSTGTNTFLVNQFGDVEVNNNLITSGITWTPRSAAEANSWRGVTYGNGRFVAVSYDGVNETMSSPDGVTWTAHDAPEANDWYSITYGNGLFVAVSLDGTNRVMTSPDGATWTGRAAAEANTWCSVTYGNGTFVAVSSDGTNQVMTSPDGITWTARAEAEANQWRAVTYGNGTFVAVADSGTNRVMTSSDGITWTPHSAAEANGWYALTYGNGLFVAVSYDGTNQVMTSPDGVTWTARADAEANSWQSVTYGNGLFVAIAEDGTHRIMTSPDGIAWTARAISEANLWTYITYGNGRFVAISANGTNRVITSGRPEVNTVFANNTYQGGMNVYGQFNIGTTSNTDNSIFNIATTTGTSLLTMLGNGNVGVGTTTPAAKLSIGSTGLDGAGIAGIDQYLQTANSVESAVQYGNRYYLHASNTATTTLVGSMFRIKDETTFGNVVRGIEIQAHRGDNTLGENTALSLFGRTFGVRSVTTGDAGASYEPAAGFFETEGTTQGNAIRAYSDTITTASLLSLFHSSSTFEGTGLVMNFGNGDGSFSSTTSKYLDFKNSNVSVFSVSAYGTTTIGDGTMNHMASLQIGYGGICVDNDGTCTATSTGWVVADGFATGNSDLAEMYFSKTELEPGELVALKGELSVDRATTQSTLPVLGVVSTNPGLTIGTDDTSLTAGESAYPIALSGRVPVKLSTENGPIKKGDQLMLSSLPGIAMKATGTGATIGIALEDFDDGRYYSDTYLNQFGDSMVEPNYEPIFTEYDSRIDDGCYFGGGNAIGDEQCVPLSATSSEGIVEEANAIAEQESIEEQLDELRAKRSEVVDLSGEVSVRVGQIVIFVDRGYRWFDDRELAGLQTLMSTTSITAVGENENETLFDRLVMLANRFIDGVLSVFELKADRVEVADELCVDDVCVTADDLRALLNSSSQPSGSVDTAVSPDADESDSASGADSADDDTTNDTDDSNNEAAATASTTTSSTTEETGDEGETSTSTTTGTDTTNDDETTTTKQQTGTDEAGSADDEVTADADTDEDLGSDSTQSTEQTTEKAEEGTVSEPEPESEPVVNEEPATEEPAPEVTTEEPTT